MPAVSLSHVRVWFVSRSVSSEAVSKQVRRRYEGGTKEVRRRYEANIKQKWAKMRVINFSVGHFVGCNSHRRNALSFVSFLLISAHNRHPK